MAPYISKTFRKASRKTGNSFFRDQWDGRRFWFYRSIVVSSLTFISLSTFSQTGPGGVSSGSVNLLLWLDGQNVNADGTNPAIGSTVTTWYDRSGNGVNVTQNISNVATYSATGVTFNNTGYLKGIDATFPTGSGARTVIVCAASPSTNADDVLFFYGTASNNQAYGILKRGNGTATPNGVRNYFYNNDLDVAGGWTPSNTLKIITATYQPNAQIVHVNNNAGSTRTPGTVNTTLGTQGLQIGGWNSFNLYSQATISEVIFYNKVLNNAERIIVNNYLAAKYGLTISNDFYDEDTNGGYTYEVAGIGQAGAGNSNQDAQGDIVRINDPTGLGNNEYYIWGHDNGALAATTTDIPTSALERMARIWRGSETGAISSFDVSFDMTGFGPFAASDLRLLVDTDNDGSFADEVDGTGVISGAVDVGSNVYRFDNVTALNNNLRFTIATASVPLPVDLLSFEAHEEKGQMKLTWSTANETNNDYFTIERSSDGHVFELVAKKSGAGNSKKRNDYHLMDPNPYKGKSYYRLSQTDYDGKTKYFPLESVEVGISDFTYKLYPNPSHGEFDLEMSNVSEGALINVAICDLRGNVLFSVTPPPSDYLNSSLHIVPEQKLKSGMYIVKVIHAGGLYMVKLLVD